MTLKHMAWTAALLLVTAPSLSAAQGQAPQAQQAQRAPQADPNRPHRRPPVEAFNACLGQKIGAVVSIVTPRGDLIPAHCIQRGEDLFARPDQPPPDRGDRPEGPDGREGGPPSD